MNTAPQSGDDELKRREELLREREIQVRLRELEAEVTSTPVQPTFKHEKLPSKKKAWYRKIPEIAKFFLVVVAVIVAVRIAAWMATAVIVLGVGWIGYKLFLEGDRG